MPAAERAARPAGLQPRHPLGAHTSLKVGGPADYFLQAGSADELVAALRWARQADLPARVIGGGSNLLVADQGAGGLVVRASGAHVEVIERAGGPVVVAEAGAPLAGVGRSMSKRGYGGLEWATNVPGTVGGAAVNNAGAFGGDTASCLVALDLADGSGRPRRLEPGELEYGYRSSLLKRRGLGEVAVTRVELRLRPSTPGAAQARVAAFQAERTRSQPRLLSAGSVFANPPGGFAGRLIEEAGLKGARAGGAQISAQHANFIVNLGGATAADVYALMRRAQDAVYARSGVWLRPEIELLGRWSAAERAALAPMAGADGR